MKTVFIFKKNSSAAQFFEQYSAWKMQNVPLMTTSCCCCSSALGIIVSPAVHSTYNTTYIYTAWSLSLSRAIATNHSHGHGTAADSRVLLHRASHIYTYNTVLAWINPLFYNISSWKIMRKKIKLSHTLYTYCGNIKFVSHSFLYIRLIIL